MQRPSSDNLAKLMVQRQMSFGFYIFENCEGTAELPCNHVPSRGTGVGKKLTTLLFPFVAPPAHQIEVGSSYPRDGAHVAEVLVKKCFEGFLRLISPIIQLNGGCGRSYQPTDHMGRFLSILLQSCALINNDHMVTKVRDVKTVSAEIPCLTLKTAK